MNWFGGRKNRALSYINKLLSWYIEKSPKCSYKNQNPENQKTTVGSAKLENVFFDYRASIGSGWIESGWSLQTLPVG